MEVVNPITRSPDFHFSNTTFSPYPTSPSSPIPFGDWYNYFTTSAPASPTHFTASPSRFDRPVSHRTPEKSITRPLRNSMVPNSSRNLRRKSRSLSPSKEKGLLTKNGSPSTNSFKYGLSKKWPRLKDLLLFRSASEGRVTGRGSKDPLQKYAVLPSVALVNKKGAGEDKKAGGGETVRRGSRPAVSAHEKHYTANRAAAEEQKRRTPLPFQRHGLLGFIDLSPAIRGKSKGASSPKGIF